MEHKDVRGQHVAPSAPDGALAKVGLLAVSCRMPIRRIRRSAQALALDQHAGAQRGRQIHRAARIRDRNKPDYLLERQPRGSLSGIPLDIREAANRRIVENGVTVAIRASDLA